MNPEDTTTSTVQDTVQAQEIAQPEELETQAVQSEDESSAQDTTEQPTLADDGSSEEADLITWAEKKGVKTDDPIAVLRMAREAEKKMHETQNSIEARQLRETFNTIGEEQGLDDTSLLVNRLTVTDFYLNNPEARKYDDTMADIVRSKPYLANDLDAVYKLAKYDSAEKELLAQRQLVQKETLAQVAKAEVAAPPQASASTRETGPEELSDEDIANMSLSEYEDWKKNSGYNPFVAP